MRKLLAVAITSFLIIGLSSAAWCSVEGDWDMTGKMSAKVKIQGEGSKKLKAYVVDEFTFSPGGDFEMIDAGGSWIQTGKKFIVELDRDSIEALYEDTLYSVLGVHVNVNVIEATITGTENKNNTIKAKFNLLMTFENDFYDLYGTAQAKASLKGTRWGNFQSSMAEEGAPSQFDSALLEAVQKAIQSSTIEK